MIHYLRGEDLLFSYHVINDDETAFDMDDLNDAFAYAMVNKKQVGMYSLHEAGYDPIVIGEDPNELVIPIDGDVNIDWPKGLLEFRIELVIDETHFDPEGRNQPIVVTAGMLE